MEMSAEEVLMSLWERIEILEGFVSEMYMDHEALFYCMRQTGQFSRDMFEKKKQEMIRELEENGNRD